MTLYAVKMLKNRFYPLEIPNEIELNNGDFILVKTEKGEEAFPAYKICKNIQEKWQEQ